MSLNGLFGLQIGFGTVSTDVAFLSSIAIIAGAIFVIFQLRDDKELIKATMQQASAAADQAKLSTEQLKQNNRLATMDLVVRIYDMANSLEVQRSWTTVLKTKMESFKDFEKLPEDTQLAFYQTASLFESIGLLVEKGYAELDLVDDMFAIRTAWNSLQPFVIGMREKHPDEEYFLWFEKLSNQLDNP
ncbi:MAG: hypothetical protein JRN15_19775 [Nitrososphaerota archaeon]|nr:hypothetical protein [Nitrososphaerota archaeon]